MRRSASFNPLDQAAAAGRESKATTRWCIAVSTQGLSSSAELEPEPSLLRFGVFEMELRTPDGKAYAYSDYRRLSELFVVEGLR